MERGKPSKYQHPGEMRIVYMAMQQIPEMSKTTVDILSLPEDTAPAFLARPRTAMGAREYTAKPWEMRELVSMV